MANTYLTKTNGTPTSTKKGTFSVWLKRSAISTNSQIASSYTNGDNRVYWNFNADDTMTFYSKIADVDTDIKTTRKFRDTSAWYHIVLAVDTSESSADNRCKIYVNGVQETAFSTNTKAALNADVNMFKSGVTFRIGAYADTANNFFNGVMSHIHFCDGLALAPTVFGSTDSTTGEWKINTAPTFTPGNNGFTILKDGNTITDQSANSNNFTASGTLTKTEDCPSNVFATLNPLSGSTSNNTLSNGNNTIAVTSGWRWRPSTIAPSSGKYYAEFKPTSSGNIYTAIGVTPQVSWDSIDGETIGSGTGGENKSVAYTHSGTFIKGNSTIYSGSSYAPNDIVGVALDLDNHKVYFSKNGAYQNSGNPESGSTGTGAVSLDATIDDWSISASAAGTTISCNYGNGFFGTTAVSSAGTNASGNGIFEYNVPAGYTALSTKGLNT